MGAVLGILLATRDSRQRMLAGSAFSAGLFGITEPAIYGLTLPLRRPFIFGCIAGAIGGAITAFSNSYAYSFGVPNIFFPAQMIPPGGIDFSVWGGLIGTGVAFILACVLTFFAGMPRSRRTDGRHRVCGGKRYSGADVRQRAGPRPCRIAPSPAVCWVKAWPLFQRWARSLPRFLARSPRCFRLNTLSAC